MTTDSSEGSIMRLLLEGALPICVDCGRALEPGEPRVTVANPVRPKAPWLRCGDCEYRRKFT